MIRVALLAAASFASLILAGSSPSPAGQRLDSMIVAGARETQGFGCTALELEPPDPDCPTGHRHDGIDLAAPEGSPVRAAAAGTATVVDTAGGYGLHVLLRHDPILSTLYGHLSAALVKSGDSVAAGAPIGLVGSTGLSTGPHLHFEVRRGGSPVDPVPYLKGGSSQWSTASS